MHRRAVLLLLLFSALNAFAGTASNQLVTINTPREFPAITSREQWLSREQLIREQILVSSGLWPMPEKTPLHEKIFAKIDRDVYSVEKVYFQSVPGFYVAGNLYRPRGRGKGPFPAVLAPHGHWEVGRLVDAKDASYPGLCINFARQGIIAFSYDMVGYNDTHFADSPTNQSFYKLHRNFEMNDPTALLWNVSLMGLQTWNSIRALDFLASLPDVDTNRLGCTGASGGGTQTMLLGAIDDRIKALAPVVMVSHTMQGGCLCENMPGLRVEFSNMEIAAAAAPRPQIMIGATGDWTKTMMEVEGPAVAHIYDLFNAPENLRYVRFNFPHNYNQTSREAVYQWFDHELLGMPDAPVKELNFQKEPNGDLRVFANGKLPPNALTQAKLVKELIKMHQNELRDLQPRNQKSLEAYQKTMKAAWKRTFHLPTFWIDLKSSVQLKSAEHENRDYHVQHRAIQRGGEKPFKYLCFFPDHTNGEERIFSVVLADPHGRAAFCHESGAPKELVRQLLDKHMNVIVPEEFSHPEVPDEKSIFFNTYNLTSLQSNVRDLVSLCQESASFPGLVLWGIDDAGFWCLLAAPNAGTPPSDTSPTAVVADCDRLDVSNDKTFLAPNLFCPGLRNIDTFNGALILAAPHPLLLHNTAGRFPTDGLKSAYKILGASDKFRVEKEKLTDEQIVEWISKIQN